MHHGLRLLEAMLELGVSECGGVDGVICAESFSGSQHKTLWSLCLTEALGPGGPCSPLPGREGICRTGGPLLPHE